MGGKCIIDPRRVSCSSTVACTVRRAVTPIRNSQTTTTWLCLEQEIQRCIKRADDVVPQVLGVRRKTVKGAQDGDIKADGRPLDGMLYVHTYSVHTYRVLVLEAATPTGQGSGRPMALGLSMDSSLLQSVGNPKRFACRTRPIRRSPQMSRSQRSPINCGRSGSRGECPEGLDLKIAQ
jgi:hypothetical protein